MSQLEVQSTGIPVPRPSPTMRPYWDGCRAGQLLFQRCTACGHINPKPGPVCSRCVSTALTWEPSGGLGTLYSWTVVWRPQHPSFRVPYAPAIVALAEGARLLTSVIGCEVADLRPDLPVAVEFHPASDEVWLPYVRPSPSP